MEVLRPRYFLSHLPTRTEISSGFSGEIFCFSLLFRDIFMYRCICLPVIFDWMFFFTSFDCFCLGHLSCESLFWGRYLRINTEILIKRGKQW